MAWQTHREGRLAVGRVRGERAAARVHDLLCDIEAEAEIPGCRFLVMPCSPEGLEDERKHIFGNGLPLVADVDDNLRAVGVRLHDDGRSRRGVLDGVPRY